MGDLPRGGRQVRACSGELSPHGPHHLRLVPPLRRILYPPSLSPLTPILPILDYLPLPPQQFDNHNFLSSLADLLFQTPQCWGVSATAATSYADALPSLFLVLSTTTLASATQGLGRLYNFHKHMSACQTQST
jgi:hypothetical protein